MELALEKTIPRSLSAARIAGRPLTADQYFLVPDDEREIEVVNWDYFDRK